MSAPRISVVLPTYNGARFLREAVASVQAQTCADWELIAVDDGSTDGTPEILRERAAADPRIAVIVHEVNRRLPGALNTGFARARGRYFTWIADDNLFRPPALERMAGHLDAHPELGLVYAAATVVDEAGRPLRRRPAAGPETLAERNPVGWCFLYRAEAARAAGDYDPAAFLAEDYDYWLRLSMRAGVGRIEEDLFLYREHAASLSVSRREECRRAALAVQTRNLPRLRWARRGLRAPAYWELAAFWLREGRPATGLACLARSLADGPGYGLRRLRGRLLRRPAAAEGRDG